MPPFAIMLSTNPCLVNRSNKPVGRILSPASLFDFEPALAGCWVGVSLVTGSLTALAGFSFLTVLSSLDGFSRTIFSLTTGAGAGN